MILNNCLLFLVFTSFSLFQPFYCSSRGFEVVGIRGLNPENDPVYEPEMNKRGLEIKVPVADQEVRSSRFDWDATEDPVYEPSSDRRTPSGGFAVRSPTKSSASMSPINSSGSSSPTTTSSPSSSPEASLRTLLTDIPFIPKRSRGHMAFWHMKEGLPQDNVKTMALLDTPCKVKDVINELNLPVSRATYSMVSHKYLDRDLLMEKLGRSTHLKINFTKKKDALLALRPIANILDKEMSEGSVIALILSFTAKNHSSIKIIIDSHEHSKNLYLTRKELVEEFGNVSFYLRYKI